VPDDIWIADWNGEETTSDPYVPATDWAGSRIHQYSGGQNVTYGGVTLNVDGDYLGGATADTGTVITDGDFVAVDGVGNVYEIVGGAPLAVTNWSPFGAPQPVETITQAQFNALGLYPANGTFLTAGTAGANYRVAGGAAIAVPTWEVFGGPEPTQTVDPWNLMNAGNPLSHLLPVPANGTTVVGLPSGAYWSFIGGTRTPAPANANAVQVADAGLDAYPITECVVPRLHHMSLVRARAALGRADCSVGRVRRPRRWGRHHLLRVFGQSAPVHSTHPDQYEVNLRLT